MTICYALQFCNDKHAPPATRAPSEHASVLHRAIYNTLAHCSLHSTRVIRVHLPEQRETGKKEKKKQGNRSILKFQSTYRIVTVHESAGYATRIS